MTFTLEPCRCTTYGDRFLADADVLGPRREAYRSCEQCRGAGSVAYPCYRCGRRGRRRAQLVVTVANLDTGAVASHQVVPGGLDPHRDPAGHWVVDLASRVRELAATVGAVLDEADAPSLWLDRQWRPDLPAARAARAGGPRHPAGRSRPLAAGAGPIHRTGDRRPGRTAGPAVRAGRPAAARPDRRGPSAGCGVLLGHPVRGARLPGAARVARLVPGPAGGVGLHRRGQGAQRPCRAWPDRSRPAAAPRLAAPTRRSGRGRRPTRTPRAR